MKTGLVLEGGGMRGMYTIGILDYFLDAGINFDYVIGVSAGACNGVSFVSKQKGRSYRINSNYIDDKRYLSVSNLIKEGSLFGMDFLFKDIPEVLEPFDYNTFMANPTEMVVGTTDIETGLPAYYDKNDLFNDTTSLRASSAIPCFSPIVEYQGRKLLDGGTAAPIPFKKALEDGCDRLVIISTRERGYRKKPQSMKPFYHTLYRKYPALCEVMDRRHLIYNRTLDDIYQLEAEGKVIFMAPEQKLSIDRFEKDLNRLKAAADVGRNDAIAIEPKLREFLGL